MHICIYIYIYVYTHVYGTPCGGEVLHVMFRCLTRNARRNTMSHLTADAVCSHTSLAKRLM